MRHRLSLLRLGLLAALFVLASPARAGNAWAWGNNSTGQLGLNDKTNRLTPTNLQSLGRVIAVSSGGNHTLALRADGTVWAWGKNDLGQLGDNTIKDRLTPVQVQSLTASIPRPTYGPLTNIIAVSAGVHHSLALGADGTVWTWGSNDYGQLGRGTGTYSSLPSRAGWYNELLHRFNPLTGIKSISAGGYHNLTVNGSGQVYGWGQNGLGQLGLGTTTEENVPRMIQNFPNVVSVAAGGWHSLALRSDGTVWSWGNNDVGELGNDSTVNRSSPGPVYIDQPMVNLPLTSVTAISAGSYHSMALTAGGRVYAWGDNYDGQLGLNSTHDMTRATLVSALTHIRAISAGGAHSMAVRSDCKVYAWGANSSGQLGNNRTTKSLLPVILPAPDCIVGVSAGAYHSFALRAETRGWAWGMNDYGQLGNGTTTDSKRTVPVLQLDAPILASHTFGLRSFALRATDGFACAWGANDGELGNGGVADQLYPVLVSFPTTGGVSAISGGNYHGVGLDTMGQVWAWGANNKCQVGEGDTYPSPIPSPVRLTTLPASTSVSAGLDHSMVMAADGTVWAWGANATGQIGDGTMTNRCSPIQVPNLDNVIAISCGYGATEALRGDGTVFGWGDNYEGKLGDGTTTDRKSPTMVPSFGRVKAICAGGDFSMALRDDGTVWVWGSNGTGELGNGTATGRSLTPVQVPDLTDVKAISAGPLYCLALTADGRIWGWGFSGNGEIGDGPPFILTPTLVPYQPVDVISVQAGNGHTFAVSYGAPPYDLVSALKAAGGLIQPSGPDTAWSNVVTASPSTVSVDILDAVLLCRRVAGLDP